MISLYPAVLTPSVLIANTPWTLPGWSMANLSMIFAPAPSPRPTTCLTLRWSSTVTRFNPIAWMTQGVKILHSSVANNSSPPYQGKWSHWASPQLQAPAQGGRRGWTRPSSWCPPCSHLLQTPAKYCMKIQHHGLSGTPRHLSTSPGLPRAAAVILRIIATQHQPVQTQREGPQHPR